jgi:hypothetical protein
MLRIFSSESKSKNETQLGRLFSSPSEIGFRDDYELRHHSFCEWFVREANSSQPHRDQGLAVPAALFKRAGSRTAAVPASDFRHENDLNPNGPELLKFLSCGVVDDQVIENSQDVLPVLDDAFKERAQLRLADRFPVPLGQDGCGHFDVAP